MLVLERAKNHWHAAVMADAEGEGLQEYGMEYEQGGTTAQRDDGRDDGRSMGNYPRWGMPA